GEAGHHPPREPLPPLPIWFGIRPRTETATNPQPRRSVATNGAAPCAVVVDVGAAAQIVVASRRVPREHQDVPCPICDDTGWKSIDVDGVSRVERCDCVRDSLVARLTAEARIPRRYQHCDFTNYTAYNELLTRALTRTRQLAERFPVVEKGVFLQGPPGVGKTHLAVAVLRQVITTRGARAVFYFTRDLLRLISTPSLP